ncbi:MAG: hypothetical protein WCR55_02655 [Lentisphaerota bacterium]
MIEKVKEDKLKLSYIRPRLSLLGGITHLLCKSGSGATGNYFAAGSNCRFGFAPINSYLACSPGGGNDQPTALNNCISGLSNSNSGCIAGGDNTQFLSNCEGGNSPSH